MARVNVQHCLTIVTSMTVASISLLKIEGADSIHFSRIEMLYAHIDRFVQQLDSRFLFGRWAVELRQAHTAETDCGKYPVGVSQCSLLHRVSLLTRSEITSHPVPRPATYANTLCAARANR